jgi:hypothetical protein
VVTEVEQIVILNQYNSWLKGEFLDLTLEREEIDEHTVWRFNKREE